MRIKTCKHWACNVSNSTCVGCGVVVCTCCLQEPHNCKCEGKESCCSPR